MQVDVRALLVQTIQDKLNQVRYHNSISKVTAVKQVWS